MYFKYRTYKALFCSQYYRVNTVRINFTIFTIKGIINASPKSHLPYKDKVKSRQSIKMAAIFCSVKPDCY